MTRELVFVHGRAQEHKDAVALKKEWIDTLKEGLSKNGLNLPIPEDRIRFPFYGDTLNDLVTGVEPGKVAEVIVKGSASDPQMRAFMTDVLTEVIKQKGISEEKIQAEAEAAAATDGGAVVVEKSILNWPWVRGILSAIDRYVPFGSGASIALATQDVYQYLTNQGIRDTIEDGVRKAMNQGVESVVVSHSLGTVVAYNLLRREGGALGWNVPLFVTLGSPLGVTRIRDGLKPIKYPGCVKRWFNAMDPDDIVALYPLDQTNFPVVPPIDNKTDIDNQTNNQHGITGYLNDAVVARRIYDALAG